MKKFFKYAKADRIIKWSLTAALLILIAELGYIGIFYFSLPPVLPLFNQMPWGQDRLGTRVEILLPVLITVSFFIINLILALKMYEKMPLVSRIVSITTVLISLLSFIFVVRTLQLIL